MDTKGCNTHVCLYEAQEALRLGLVDDAREHIQNALIAYRKFEENYSDRTMKLVRLNEVYKEVFDAKSSE